MSRRKKEEDSRTVDERQRDFLTAYADTLNLTRAAEIANVGRASHYRWLRKDAKYAAAFTKCKETAGQRLERWIESVFYQRISAAREGRRPRQRSMTPQPR